MFKLAAVPISILALFLVYWLLPNRKIPPARVAPAAIFVGLILESLKYVNLADRALLAGEARTRVFHLPSLGGDPAVELHRLDGGAGRRRMDRAPQAGRFGIVVLMKNWVAIAQAHGLESLRERVGAHRAAAGRAGRDVSPPDETADAGYGAGLRTAPRGGRRMTIRGSRRGTARAPVFRRGTGQHRTWRASSGMTPACARSSPLPASRRSNRRGRRTANSPPARIAARCTAFRSRLKDLFGTKGVRTTAGSKVYENFVPETQRHGGGEAAGRGRRDAGQAQYARAGLRDHFGQSAFRPGAQSVESAAQSGRVERRIGRGGGHADGLHGDGQRYRRLDPHSRVVLRDRRAQAHLWTREPFRRAAAGLQPGPRGPAHPLGARRRADAERDRRPRSARSGIFAPPRGGFRAGRGLLHPRPAHRLSGELFFRASARRCGIGGARRHRARRIAGRGGQAGAAAGHGGAERNRSHRAAVRGVGGIRTVTWKTAPSSAPTFWLC